MNEVAATPQPEETPVTAALQAASPSAGTSSMPHSGFEKKVAQAILETAAQKGLSESFEQVVVPTENVVEVRRGKKTAAERKFFPWLRAG